MTNHREFVALMAMLIGLSALAIDIMLPALPIIAHDYALTPPESAQQALTIFFLGFGLGQLFVGPLSDRWGRKPILFWGTLIYIVSALAAIFSDNFDQLMICRFFQGVGAAAPRVMAVAIIRDCHTGRMLGRVMSLSIMTFLFIPVVAPALGQTILTFSHWRYIFAALALGGMVAMVWANIRLKETLETKQSLHWRTLWTNTKTVLGHHQTFTYMFSASCVLGTLFSYLASSAYILGIHFDLGTLFPYAFGLQALGMMAGSFLNARLVVKFGLKNVSHYALAIYMFCGMSIFFIDISYPHSFWAFYILSSCQLMTFTFIMSNFNSLSLDPHGKMGGLASSLVSATTTTLGGCIAWSGSLLPITSPWQVGMIVFAGAFAAAIIIAGVRIMRRLAL